MVNFATNLKVKIYSTSHGFSVTKIVTWVFHADNSAKSRYDMILGRYIFAALGLNLKFSEHVIKGGDGPFEGFTVPMINLRK